MKRKPKARALEIAMLCWVLVGGPALAGMTSPQDSKNDEASPLGNSAANSPERSCGANSPAVPIPETCRVGDVCTGNLWPVGFSPVRPGEQLPASRDSTQYITQTFPDAQAGHELFRSLDIEQDYLFALYTNGIQAWNLGVSAEMPSQLDYRDGYGGHFLSYPVPGETDNWLEDVDAIRPSGGSDFLLGVAGRDNVGLSIWSYSTTTSKFARLYQDPRVVAFQVRMVEVEGRVYALVAADGDGVQVYDATRALDFSGSGCLDNATGTACSGVSKGRVGGPGELPKARSMDLLVRDDLPYIAVGDGIGSGALTLELWEVANPANPSTAERRFEGGDSATHGVALFQRETTYYLGAIAADSSTAAGTLSVFDVTSCLDSDGCLNMPLSSYGSFNFPGLPTHFPVARHLLTYSESDGDSFLYHGVLSAKPWGAGLEHLLDLSTAGSMVEITASGGTYTEGCNGRTGIDYWGDYYEKNEHGLRNVVGAVGMFQGSYFYRAAGGVLDIHQRTESAVPRVTTVVQSEPPYWFDVSVPFAAFAENCSGPDEWTWSATNTNASGLGNGGDEAQITWALCTGSVCPSETIGVEAIKDACQGEPQLLVLGAEVILEDPRPEIEGLIVASQGGGGTVFPQGVVLTFSATVKGRPPLHLEWQIFDEDGDLIAQQSGDSFVWDTSMALPASLFDDGFESGDTTVWGSSSSLLFDVRLTATNDHDPVGDVEEVSITLTAGATTKR